ncbi:hypothetical protein P4647_12200 [Peribacillus frigoritolerans]|uniref:hypothetical protein n=1 Tax=Peribacillus frigoritolerans TaxID=450367 RepID=UPI002E245AF4|nr:hypothetical protein [Peribacillus frigoritolerans]
MTTDTFAIILIPPKMMTAVTIARIIAVTPFSIPNNSLNALVIVLVVPNSNSIPILFIFYAYSIEEEMLFFSKEHTYFYYFILKLLKLNSILFQR